MDIESARQNMVDCQIKTCDVFDSAVIEAFRRIKREDFVPLKYKKLAFADTMLDIGQNQQMMSPKVEARLLQALAIQATDKVLEVGTGTGHLTALLATLANKVFSFECDSELHHSSESNLKTADFKNVHLHLGDGANGCHDFAPYDVIVLSGSIPARRKSIEEQLIVGGRMFAIIGSGAVMDAVLIKRITEHDWYNEVLFETSAEVLEGTKAPILFEFT